MKNWQGISLSLLLAGAGTLTAQRVPSSGTTPTPTSSTGGTGSMGSTGNTQQSNPVTGGQSDNSLTRPIFISGRVMMDDGSPAPLNISIQRICTGNARTAAYTDSKGHFNFQWGDTNGIVPDASEAGMGASGRMSSTGSNMGSRGGIGAASPLMGCELRASSAGYQSDRVDLSSQRVLDNGDVGTIVLHRMANVEGRSISATSLNAPKEATKAWEKGTQALTKNKPADAAKDFEKAVEIYPKFASAWFDLGRARLAQQDTAGAKEAMLKSIDVDDKLVGPYVELGQLAAKEQKWDDTAKYLDRVLHLDPVDFPQLWFIDGVANYNNHQYDAAEHSVREAIKVDPLHKNPRNSQLLGLILYEKGDAAGASAALHEYLTLSPGAPDADQMKQRLAALEHK